MLERKVYTHFHRAYMHKHSRSPPAKNGGGKRGQSPQLFTCKPPTISTATSTTSTTLSRLPAIVIPGNPRVHGRDKTAHCCFHTGHLYRDHEYPHHPYTQSRLVCAGTEDKCSECHRRQRAQDTHQGPRVDHSYTQCPKGKQTRLISRARPINQHPFPTRLYPILPPRPRSGLPLLVGYRFRHNRNRASFARHTGQVPEDKIHFATRKANQTQTRTKWDIV